jgi:hypothetical protein
MKRAVTNIAASVRQRLLNEAKRRGESFDYVASLGEFSTLDAFRLISEGGPNPSRGVRSTVHFR